MKRQLSLLLAAVTIAILPLVSTVGSAKEIQVIANANEKPLAQSAVPAARLARLRHGINLSHWFAQARDYSRAHLETHTTDEDIALIKKLGFDHVRFTIEPAPLFEWSEPGKLNTEYLNYLDSRLDVMLAQGLAVIVDVHPSDEFKLKINSDEHSFEAFRRFWQAFAEHLAKRDPEFLFLEVINEPMVEDGSRWFGMQGKLIEVIRAGAPRHTIIAAGHRWSGPAELLFLQPYPDRNIIYTFHFYEPFAFTHQGANWSSPHLAFYKNIPYPSSPENVAKVLDTVHDEQARKNLIWYGEQRWDAARIDAEIAKVAAWARKYQVPITCNEFGAYRNFAPPVDRATWIRDLRSGLEEHGIGWTMWDYGGGFGVVTKQNGHATPDREITKALGLALKE